jgi:nicotinate-nucleotide adenylyltransferase
MRDPGEAPAHSRPTDAAEAPGPRHPRLGLLGGTFDPPHSAHLQMARAALVAGLVDEVVVIPAGDPWQKAPETPARHRLAMARLAFHDEPYCIVDDIEVRRAGPTYAIDTVTTMHSPHLQLRYIIGSDTLALLPTWHRIDALARLCDFLVVKRPGSLVLAPEIEGLAIELVPGDELADASATIRAEIAHTRQRPSAVAAEVWDYIVDHDLYGVRGA